ncbi:MAG: O-antigen ligase family protein, partial [Tepidisphaeraceae bacterium]
DLTGARDIFWSVPNPTGELARAGPFVNHSHFGQFMNLSIGAAMGRLLMEMREHFHRGRYTADQLIARARAREFRPARLLMLAIALCGTAMVLSLSRGAILSGLVAAVATGMLIATRRGLRGMAWLPALPLIAVIVAAIYLGFEEIARRFLQLQDDPTAGSRVEIVRDLLRAWRQFPALGTGLGTFAQVFPMFDRSQVVMFATHAENEYVQTLAECGIVGFGLVLTFMVMIGVAFVRTIYGSATPASSAAIGLGYGLIAVLLQSVTDFGQHLPANALLTAVTCATMLNLGELRRREQHIETPPLAPRGALWTRSGALVVVCMIFAAALFDSAQVLRADVAWQRVRGLESRMSRDNRLNDDEHFASIILSADEASKLRPGRVDYRYFLNYYRWMSISRDRNARTGLIVLTPQQIEWARRIALELQQARKACPTFGPAYLLAGQIEDRFLEDPSGARHIRTGFELAGNDPSASLLAAELDARDGDLAGAKEKLARALRLNPGTRGEAIELCLAKLNRPDIAMELAFDDTDSLELLKEALEKRGEKDQAARAADRMFVVLRRMADEPHATSGVLLRMARESVRQGDDENAVPYFRRALNLDYGQSVWRIELAQTLVRLGRYQEALREAQICLNRRPNMPEAEALIARLNARGASQSPN